MRPFRAGHFGEDMPIKTLWLDSRQELAAGAGTGDRGRAAFSFAGSQGGGVVLHCKEHKQADHIDHINVVSKGLLH